MIEEPSSLVIVEWIDAHTDDGWDHFSEFAKHGPYTVYSVGWVIRDDNQGIWLTHGWSKDPTKEEPDGLNATFIPRGMVQSVRQL